MGVLTFAGWDAVGWTRCTLAWRERAGSRGITPQGGCSSKRRAGLSSK